MMASFALVMALGALGRGDEMTAVADRALDVPRRRFRRRRCGSGSAACTPVHAD